jgi:mercuric ion transport protein
VDRQPDRSSRTSGYFLAVAAVFVGLGFWRVYFRPKSECVEGSCASPQSSWITKTALWIAIVLIAINATVDWWAPLFY